MFYLLNNVIRKIKKIENTKNKISESQKSKFKIQ